ncbi:Tyrosine-protein phosphatase non-receptor type 22 [Smittium culicis]|uniref:protein-tyrosine-phosphatase n=1 Tax=Smittium culicis TaxID=133412 RepID=A0A1R1Y471_9FUNG|nr:Tyrosine-protein phosphatase non-receptor type 22 [Smittium culicis]
MKSDSSKKFYHKLNSKFKKFSLSKFKKLKSKPNDDLLDDLSDLGSDSAYVFMSDLEDLFESGYKSNKPPILAPKDYPLQNDKNFHTGSLPLNFEKKSALKYGLIQDNASNNNLKYNANDQSKLNNILQFYHGKSIDINKPTPDIPTSRNSQHNITSSNNILNYNINDFSNDLNEQLSNISADNDSLDFKKSKTTQLCDNNSYDHLKATLGIISKNYSPPKQLYNEYPFLSTHDPPLKDSPTSNNTIYKSPINKPQNKFNRLSKPKKLSSTDKTSSQLKTKSSISSTRRAPKKKKTAKIVKSGTINAEDASKLVQRRIDFLYSQSPSPNLSSNSSKPSKFPNNSPSLPQSDTLYSSADLSSLTISLIFIVDVRCLAQYENSHIIGAISIQLLKAKSSSKTSTAQLLDDYLKELTLSQFPGTTKHRHIVLFYDDGVSGAAWKYATLYKELQSPHSLLSLDCSYESFSKKFSYLCTSHDSQFPEFSLLNNLIKSNTEDSNTISKFSKLISDLAITEKELNYPSKFKSSPPSNNESTHKTLKITDYHPPKWLVDRSREDTSNPGVASSFFNKIESSESSRLQEMAENQNKNVVMEYSFESGKNRIAQNRYPNILPYDSTRVPLKSKFTTNDYINASFVGLPGGPQYIVTQGPMESTVTDFWQMIWEQNIGVVVMLGDLVELGREKCFQYWPKSFGIWQRFKLKPKTDLGEATISVRMEAAAKDCNFDGIVVRLFRARLSINGRLVGKARMITHIQYTDWADNKAPSNPQVFLRVVKLVNCATGFTTFNTIDSQHIVVHCSAGCGRSGVFCTVDTALRLKKGDNPVIVEDYDPLFSIVSAMRRQRVGIVQNLDQFLFCYKALYNSFKEPELKYPQLDVVVVPVEQLKLVIRWNRLKSKVYAPDSAHMVWIMVAFMEISNELSTFQKQFNSKRPNNLSNSSLTEFERPFSTSGFISKPFYSSSSPNDSLEIDNVDPNLSVQKSKSESPKEFVKSVLENSRYHFGSYLFFEKLNSIDTFGSNYSKKKSKFLGVHNRSNSLNISVTTYTDIISNTSNLIDKNDIQSQLNGSLTDSDHSLISPENDLGSMRLSRSPTNGLTSKRPIKKASPTNSKSSSHKILLTDLLSPIPSNEKNNLDKVSPFTPKKNVSSSKKPNKNPNLFLNLESSFINNNHPSKNFPAPFNYNMPATPKAESFSAIADPLVLRNKNKLNLSIQPQSIAPNSPLVAPPRPKKSFSKIVPSRNAFVSSATSVNSPSFSGKKSFQNPEQSLQENLPATGVGLKKQLEINLDSSYISSKTNIDNTPAPSTPLQDILSSSPVLKEMLSKISMNNNETVTTPKNLSPQVISSDSRNDNTSNSTLFSSNKGTFFPSMHNSPMSNQLEFQKKQLSKLNSFNFSSTSEKFIFGKNNSANANSAEASISNYSNSYVPDSYGSSPNKFDSNCSSPPNSVPATKMSFPFSSQTDTHGNTDKNSNSAACIDNGDFLILSELSQEDNINIDSYNINALQPGLVNFPRLKPSFES